MVILQFHIHFDSRPSQTVKLVGSLPCLGLWNADNSLALTWEKDNWWTTRIHLSERAIPFTERSLESRIEAEYKYVILENGVYSWEPASNHRVSLKLVSSNPDEEVTIVDTYNSQKSNLLAPPISLYHTSANHSNGSTTPVHKDYSHIHLSNKELTTIFLLSGVNCQFPSDTHRVLLVGDYNSWRVNDGIELVPFSPLGTWYCTWIATSHWPVGYSTKYKYVICSKRNNAILMEAGNDRVFISSEERSKNVVVYNDGIFRRPEGLRGSGDSPVNDDKEPLRYTSWLRHGYVGMINTFASCSINSVLQILYHVKPFREGLLHHFANHQEADNSKPVGVQLSSIFKKLLGDCIGPSARGLVSVLGLAEDPHEFVNLLCFYIQEEAPELSEINNLFKGQLSYTIEHGATSHKLERPQEEFFGLSLTVQYLTNLKESVEAFLTSTPIEYNIKDEGVVTALQTIHIHKLPPYLMFHLKRSVYDPTIKKEVKLGTRFEFPVQINTLEYFPSLKQDTSYSLFGVVAHRGVSSAEAGHYFAFINLQNLWYQFDDERVNLVSQNDVVSENYGSHDQQNNLNHAYLLVYRVNDSV
eukprot:TRINITY_DN758_c0_g1_i12.p1 TRINITY_DN758_c0_g1~~TRINITY_DN758_c0_g1_i12.p1  ORF type:complete len:585 (-),score=93.51 TRINITY_DN758_c0_g1_i12:153-1907(-)